MSSKFSAIATLRVFLYRRTAAIIESISDTASESHILDTSSIAAINASESRSVSVHLISDIKAATLDLSRAVRSDDDIHTEHRKCHDYKLKRMRYF